MDKREFLKGSSVLMAGTMLDRLAGAETNPGSTAPRTNWAGNYTYSTDRLDVAKTHEEVSHAIGSNAHMRALGSRHSFNGIADSTEEQLSLKPMDSIELDKTADTVTVGAGVTYGKLAPFIDSQGFAVHNLASLPHISVVGGCATATHGSGSRNGNLSTAVRAMEIVTADGQTKILSREKLGDRFDGTVIALGAYGIVTHITIAVEPAFQMSQVVYTDLAFAHLEHHLEAIFASGYSVSLFTDWQDHRATQVWIKRRVQAGATAGKLPPEFYGAKLQTRKLHPIIDHPAESCTEQMGAVGPWYERLPHFKMEFTPSSGQELQTEYFVPIKHGYAAIRAVEELRDQITPHLFVSEFRTIAADELWVSPCYKRASMTLHFTWKPDWPEVKKILPQIEAKLEPFAARPHWAKLFTMPPARVQGLYPRMADYKALVAEYDPRGKFRNAFLNTNLYGA